MSEIGGAFTLTIYMAYIPQGEKPGMVSSIFENVLK